MIINGLGKQKMWNMNTTFIIKQDMKTILCDRSVNGRSFLLFELPPFGKEFVECSGFETVAAEDMIANFSALFNHAD